MNEKNRNPDKVNKSFEALFEKANNLTQKQKILTVVITIALILGAYWYFFYSPQHKKLETLQKDYQSQQKKLKDYKNKAKALAEYEAKFKEARERLNFALRALPDKKEVPSLLTGISKAGNEAGLDFLLFQPGSPVQKDFYSEIPVQIEVKAGFHQLAGFFDKVSRLNRIVNIEDLHLTTSKEGGDLAASCKAVTYMFTKEENNKNQKKGK
ncbi:MAG: type 4a pilus biogenesis protein PilO [Desulfobacteraceae bacterium]